MNLRDFLRWWLRGLRATAVAVDEALMLLPTVTPDRTGYERPAQASVADVSAWIYGDVGRGFMRTAPADVRDAAVYWLALRESVTGVRLS